MPKLSNNIILKFLQLYREEECLWNVNIPSYKDKIMRDLSLKNISDKLLTMGVEMDSKEIKSKIKCLRSTYLLELRKIENLNRSSAGSHEYKSKLKWFHEMHSFIKDVTLKRKITGIQESTMDEEQVNNYIEIDIENSNDNIDEDENVANLEHLLSHTSASSSANTTQPAAITLTPIHKLQPKILTTPAPKKRKIEQVTSPIDELSSIKDDLNSTPAPEDITVPQQDENDIFCTYVASQLKMLSTARAIMARNEINDLLSRCRMQDLNYKNVLFSCQSPSLNSAGSSELSDANSDEDEN